MASRWEWRAFADHFGAVEARLRAGASVRSSHEIYVLSDLSRANVKIRDRLLDVKTLDAVDPAGLQLWRPVMKAVFPIDLATAGQVASRLGVPLPSSTRPSYSQDQWLADVVAVTPALAAVSIWKRRFGSTIDDCLVEIADLVVDGTRTRTVSVEHEEPARVLRTVHALGFDASLNQDYVTAIKRLVAHALSSEHPRPGGRTS